MAQEPQSQSPEPATDRPRLPDPGRVVVAAVLFEGGLAPLAAVLGWLLGRSPLEGFAWRAWDVALGVLFALPMYAAFRLALRWPVGPFGRIKRFFDEEIAPLLAGRPVSDLALICVAAGVGEEMLFRGLLQGVLARWVGTSGALALASVLFGVLHPISRAYVVMAGLLGAYLGAVWIVNGNLLTVIVAHALYDFLALRDLLRDRARAQGTAC